MLVKICGIRNPETAVAAVEAGADMLGFIFVLGTKRYIKPDKVRELVRNLSGQVKITGVFRDEDLETVNRIARELNLDYVQLHGSESPQYAGQISCKVIKAFNLVPDFNSEELSALLQSFNVEYFLLDRENVGHGEMLNPVKVKEITEKFPVILSGGLNPSNIQKVLERVQPEGIDVSSGVESDGEKDIEKIIDFIKVVKA